MDEKITNRINNLYSKIIVKDTIKHENKTSKSKTVKDTIKHENKTSKSKPVRILDTGIENDPDSSSFERKKPLRLELR
jgi:hypothetical protein